MANLTPAQDKALKAFGADGEFPKGTRAATIEGIRSAGLIMHWNGDDSWDLTPDGRAYLGLPPVVNTATTDEIMELLKPVHVDMSGVAMTAHYESLGWYNTSVWNGLSGDEIERDMLTRVAVNRADKRAARKHKH